MAFNESLLSSKTDQWATPLDFFRMLDQEFHFNLDPCADHANHKCDEYFTIEQDGLARDWSGHVVFCNPPYGRKIGHWVRKSYEESRKPDTVVVMLIPARTDTSYFHDYILPFAEIRFLRGRLYVGGSKTPAPFPSMVVVFRS